MGVTSGKMIYILATAGIILHFVINNMHDTVFHFGEEQDRAGYRFSKKTDYDSIDSPNVRSSAQFCFVHGFDIDSVICSRFDQICILRCGRRKIRQENRSLGAGVKFGGTL